MTNPNTALVASALRLAAGSFYQNDRKRIHDLIDQLGSGEVVLMRALDFDAIRKDVSRQIGYLPISANPGAKVASDVWQAAIEKASA